MTMIPANLARVPNALTSSIMLGAVTRTSSDLVQLQVQMASGKRLNRPSDDAIGTSAISVLDDTMERRGQRLRNLSHAESVLNTSDAALGDLSALLIEAQGIASSQIGIGSDAETRANQAQVIDTMLDEARNIANRKYQKLFLFGGSATSQEPIVGLGNGLRYQGRGDGMLTDLGLARPLPITVNGEDAFGALSSRIESNVDLDPIMDDDTRLVDLDGARGFGIGLGSVTVSNASGLSSEVDLTTAHTLGDVATALQDAIRNDLGDAAAVVRVDPLTQNRLEIIPTVEDITVVDPTEDATAADLGLSNLTFTAGAGATGADLNPYLTRQTRIDQLLGLTTPLPSIRIENVGQTRDLDLSSAETIEDLANLVEGLNIGVRVEINSNRNGLNFINEMSGGDMSIGEVGGGTIATELGVRTFDTSTLLSEFNNGLGVDILEGSTDPVTGLPDPDRDLDFRITTKDGTEIDVDLAGATTVEDVITTVHAAVTAAGLTVGVDFEMDLVDEGNGLRLTDNTNGGVGTTSVEDLNDSHAAEDLGIKGTSTSATLIGEDRAKVAVDSVFTHLIALRDALAANDERGITLAGSKIESDVTRVASARADVGVRTQRVVSATTREEDQQIQDQGLMSQIRDLDFTDAALRFSLLQQQLQAGLIGAGRTTQQTLLDFIG